MSIFALYRFYASDDALLYIGLTVNPGQRFVAHAHDKPWWTDVARITIEQHESHKELVEAERAAIIAENPTHNVIYNGPRPRVAPIHLYKGVKVGHAYGFALHDGRYVIGLIEDGDEMGIGVTHWMPSNELFAGRYEFLDGSEIARIKQCKQMSDGDKRNEGFTSDQDVWDISSLTGYGEFWEEREKIKELVERDMAQWPP